MTFTEEEARAVLKAAGKDDTPTDVARVIAESMDPTTPAPEPEGSVEEASSEAAPPDAASSGDGDAGTSPSPSEEAPVAQEAPVEPQGPPEAAPAPQATQEEIDAARTLLAAAGYATVPPG